MADIIGLFGSKPAETEEGEPITDIQVDKDQVWMAAASAALADGALYGALLYVSDDGSLCCIPIKSDEISLRGLLEESRDEFVGRHREYRG